MLLELSLNPKDRLMYLLKYSRPIGTDKKKRAFVVTRKCESLTETEKYIREQEHARLREEKKNILKRRLRVSLSLIIPIWNIFRILLILWPKTI